MPRILRRALAFTLLLSRFSLAQEANGPPPPLTYESHVRPILKVHCFQCHGEGEELQGNLDLRLRRLIVAGGDSGPAIEPGNADDSYLLQRLRDGEMPPGKRKPTDAEIATIGQWIAAGAATARPEPEGNGANLSFTEEERNFWSFQPVRRPAVPQVSHAERVRTPIDAFLLAKLEPKGLSFSPEADKRTLLRRVFMDLTGLPPTPDEAAQFLNDQTADAYERLVDRLLASPRYGERWGRHWLDVAGYADSEGYTNEDVVRPQAYKYRDYVIRAFNDDKRLDEFIREQLAGDEMLAPPYKDLRPEEIDKLVATGFLRMAADGTGSGDVDQNLARNQVVADTIKIVSSSLLGLTVGCAQCHNHRYDPIPQADYYRIRAIFEPAYDWKNWRPPPARLISLYTDADRQQAQQVEVEAAKIDAERKKKAEDHVARIFEAQLQKLPEELREPIRQARNTPADKQTAEQKQLLKDHPNVNVSENSLSLYDKAAADEVKACADRAGAVRATKPVEEFIRALTEIPGVTPTTVVFYRGDCNQPKQEVLPGDLSVLGTTSTGAIPAHDPALPTTGRRLAYARHLTDGAHPLTARVLANRVWLHHFGRGIVGTPGDFGYLGERPTHPELLDWLAGELVAGGWRLKPLHKLIVTSTAYRQSSRREPAADMADPDGRWCSRASIRRLEAEDLRDSIMAVGGKINFKMFGPPVPIREDEVGQFVIGIENRDGDGRPGEVIPMHGEESRRSVYVQVRRSRPLGVLDTFDAPAMEPNCHLRNFSTVAPQSLLLMNSEFVLSQAGFFAERVRNEAGGDPRAQVVHAWRLALAREPNEEEIKDSLALLAEQTDHFRAAMPPANAGSASADPALAALTCLCQTLLGANEFLYID